MANQESPTPLKGEAADIAQASDLCKDCGLCCTGVLHDAAVLDDDEVAAAAAVGLKLLQGSSRPGFAFPCTMLDGTRCSIFGQRPRVCGRYMCQVLVDLQEEKLTFGEAAAHVRQARRLFTSMMNARPDYLSMYDVKVMAKAGLATPGLRLLVGHATDLQRYLDEHFRKPRDEKLFDEKGGQAKG